jgi:signal transduction histidine kinase
MSDGPADRLAALSCPDDAVGFDALMEDRARATPSGHEPPRGPSPWRHLPAPAASAARSPQRGQRTAAADEAGMLLRDVNERLVRAVRTARDGQLAAEHALHRQQANLVITAHELRNPLAPMSYALALLKKSDCAREPAVERAHGILERQLAQMVRLVGDLLDVSRASTGKLRIEASELDLRALVETAVEASLPAMRSRGQAMALDFAVQGPLRVRGDAVRLMQVFANLLDNASKYTPEGGWIRFVVAREAQDVVVTISDSGIGISPEALPHVFALLVQESAATAFNGQGLGIGLMLVQQLVEAQGGTVAVRSDGRGQGSVVVVRLPLLTVAAGPR